MDILYLLIPLSAVLVLAIVGIFGWAVHAGQFEDLEGEAGRVLREESRVLDGGQAVIRAAPQQSAGMGVAGIVPGGNG